MNEDKKEFSFSAAEVRAVLGSKEGKRLIELLNSDGGAALRSAAQSVKDGNYEKAKQTVAPLLQSQEAQSLMQSIQNRKDQDG